MAEKMNLKILDAKRPMDKRAVIATVRFTSSFEGT
jgi:hypothetical protein